MLNTPQFDLCRSKLRHAARPVAPVFQPELAAESIVWAAEHRRRSDLVGGSTVLTILGNRLAPWLMERYLARTAYQGQKRAGLEPGPRPGNLFEPVSGDAGAHGSFDEEARSTSIQLPLAKHRGLAAAIVLGGAALAGYVGSRAV